MAYKSRDNRSSVLRLMDTLHENRVAKSKLKNELMKLQMQSVLRRMEKQEALKESFQQKMAQDRMNKPQKYTPEQEYLRRRSREENPLMAMSVPEEGQDMTGISFPDSVVRPDEKGVYQMRSPATDPALQTQMLGAKVAEMQAQGKRVHPAVLALLQKQIQSAPEFESREGKAPKFDPKTGKEIGKKDKRPNATTTEVLKKLSESVQSGEFKTRADLLENLEEQSPALELKDVDMNYVRKNVMKLPKTLKKEGWSFEGLLSTFGIGGKKTDLASDPEGSISLLDEEANA